MSRVLTAVRESAISELAAARLLGVRVDGLSAVREQLEGVSGCRLDSFSTPAPSSTAGGITIARPCFQVSGKAYRRDAGRQHSFAVGGPCGVRTESERRPSHVGQGTERGVSPTRSVPGPYDCDSRSSSALVRRNWRPRRRPVRSCNGVGPQRPRRDLRRTRLQRGSCPGQDAKTVDADRMSQRSGPPSTRWSISSTFSGSSSTAGKTVFPGL